jgi:hypothetical protein
MMKSFISIINLFLIIFISLANCSEIKSESGESLNALKTESWSISIDYGLSDSGNWTMTEYSNGSILANGNWDAYNVTCPFPNGSVTINLLQEYTGGLL